MDSLGIIQWEASDIWHFFSCDVRKGYPSKAQSIESIYSAIEDYWYENMSSSEEFSDTSSEEYLSEMRSAVQGILVLWRKYKKIRVAM